MTATTAGPAASRHAPPPALFALTVFVSASLVFLVEPMVAKLVLPTLGGSPSIWNTSLAFFQAALLAGYGYAHGLQRVRSVRAQVAIHGAALLLAALALPLRVNEVFGPPSSTYPNLWLLGVLTVSIGAPFAVLSATAPLVQAWHARSIPHTDGQEPYGLYAASNLGSLLALLAYPVVVEPLLTLHHQTGGWSIGYGLFAVLIAVLGLMVARGGDTPTAKVNHSEPREVISWRERTIWIALAAIPSSLMLGVTTHITTDVASAPFLWVLPLALYLLSFIVAFQAKPAISPELALLLQGAALAACASILPFGVTNFLVQLLVHLAAFFLTALMCHQTLVSRRPDASRLTEFYLWMSVGGVVGGAFNAFLAPVLFNNVWEYPLVVVLSCLARPWGRGRIDGSTWFLLVLGLSAGILPAGLHLWVAPHVTNQIVIGKLTQVDMLELLGKLCIAVATIAAFLARGRAWIYFAIIAVLSFGAHTVADKVNTVQTWRSFFGVIRQSETTLPSVGGRVKMLSHGTTLHGAQAVNPAWSCHPLVYYARTTPIGQVFTTREEERASLRIGAVGLGTGSVAAYVRPGDHLTFFEIDPLVIRISTDPAHFSYTSRCAKGPVDFVVGDARLTVAQQPKDSFDILLIDAFSSDAVPTHLLTVEAVRGYLTHLKPDGVLILHLSNRNLDLNGPAQAVAKAAGGAALIQEYRPQGAERADWASGEDAVIIGRSPAALSRFASSGRWSPTEPDKVRPWTDDYTNLIGALYRRMRDKMTKPADKDG